LPRCSSLLIIAVPTHGADVNAIAHTLPLQARDTLTPVGLWEIETRSSFFLRLPEHPAALCLLTASSVCLVGLALATERGLAAGVAWHRGKGAHAAAGAGCLAGAAIVLPVVWLAGDGSVVHSMMASDAELTASPPPAVTSHWALLLTFSLVGNLYEELLFRGFLQGCLERTFLQDITDKPASGRAAAEAVAAAKTRAALASGLAFAFAHGSLATATTDCGWVLLVFCLWEGLVAGFVYARFGLIGSTVAHGGAIFLLCGAVL